MKTAEIMKAYEYDALGGPIQAIPTSDVAQFCQRIKDRLDDIETGMPVQKFIEEINQVLRCINEQ